MCVFVILCSVRWLGLIFFFPYSYFLCVLSVYSYFSYFSTIFACAVISLDFFVVCVPDSASTVVLVGVTFRVPV